MTPLTTQVPAIDGWFTTTDEPALVGTKCASCDSYFFPPERALCRNPACMSSELTDVELSRRGKVWSFAVNHYAAPAPYVGKEPFEPYTVVAVELTTEQIVVLGQLAEGVDPSTLSIGDEMRLVIEPLFTDDQGEHVVWKWTTA
jgi:uncharacterized OB-fold protein